MYLDERSSLLLKDLVFNPHVKNKDLEEKYGLSRRQVGYSINKINSWLTSNNLPVIERAKNGFFIIQTEVRSYFKMDHQAEAAGQPYIFSENERAELILLMILSKREELALIHFTSALCVSKNTILNDLKMAQTLLQPHGLEVGYSRQSGYEMIGSEIQKRKFLIHLVQRILEKEHGEWALESVKEIHKQRKADIQQWLEQVEQQLNLTFTDEKMKQLPYILAITLERIEQFERIDAAFCIHYEELSDTKEYQAVELLLQGDETIPREERLFIALNLLASNVSSYEILTDTDLPELVKAVETTLHLFEKNACIELKEKENLTRLIFIHMKPAYYRIKYHLTTSNQYAEKIDAEFGELHFLIKQSIAPLEELIGELIPESEIVYLTMFIGGWLERQGDRIDSKIRAVVVCPNGLSVSKLMKQTLQTIFPEFLFWDALSIREFQQYTREYELVFAPHVLLTDKPLFIVKQLPTEEEKMQLRKRVMQELYGYVPSALNVEEIFSIIHKHGQIKDEKKLKKELQTLLEAKQAGAGIQTLKKQERLDLTHFINESTLTIVPSVSDWKEAIRLAAAPLVQAGKIDPEYTEAMIKEHNYENPYMVLGKHVAIPHANPEKGVHETAMGLLCIEDGVPFSDHFHIHLVVVIAAKDKEKHIRALFQLSQLALEHEEVQRIAKAKSKADAAGRIKMYIEKGEQNGQSHYLNETAD